MRFICFILPCSARSTTPGRSRRNASSANFTCFPVVRNTRILACMPPQSTLNDLSGAQLLHSSVHAPQVITQQHLSSCAVSALQEIDTRLLTAALLW